MFVRIKKSQLQRAIERGEFDIYYQPKIDTISKSVVSYEALCRWEASEDVQIEGRNPRPDEFFHAARMDGLAIALETYIARHVSCDLVRYPRLQRVSLNASPRGLRDDNFLLDLRDIFREHLDENDRQRSRIKIEATEDASFVDTAIVNIGYLRSWGFEVGIDDFAKGCNTSLTDLFKIHPDFVKFDRSLVSQCDIFDYAEFCRALVTYFNKRNITTTAEGTETQEQFEIAKAIGFTCVQGWYSGYPKKPEELFPLQ